jgi:Fe2+ transport system protein FeoA
MFVHDDALPLEMLRPGEWAEVAEVAGDSGCVARMAEMGLGVGSRLCVIQRGSPCLVQVGEARLSVRGDCRLEIFVRPI